MSPCWLFDVYFHYPHILSSLIRSFTTVRQYTAHHITANLSLFYSLSRSIYIIDFCSFNQTTPLAKLVRYIYLNCYMCISPPPSPLWLDCSSSSHSNCIRTTTMLARGFYVRFPLMLDQNAYQQRPTVSAQVTAVTYMPSAKRRGHQQQ